MLKTVYYPRHILRHGITKNDAGIEPVWNVGAGDTETVHGSPITLQLCWSGREPLVDYVEPQTVFSTFVARVEEWAHRGVVNVVFFHNLKFDMQALLYRPEYRKLFGDEKRDFIVPIRRKDDLDPLVSLPADAEHSPDDIYSSYMHVFADKTWFARLKLSDRRRVHLIDTLAFFKMSLEAAAEATGSPVRKLPRPEDKRCNFKAGIHVKNCSCLGYKDLRGDPAFERYARTDVLAQYHLGAAIHRMHEEHDVRISVSLPQLASRILRHRFFREGDSIPFPPIPVANAFELSYHGGKNGMLQNPDGTWASGFYEDVTEVDINSAYTSAMVALPSFVKGEWKEVDSFVPGSHGVYCVSGEVDCPYGCIHTASFIRVKGRFSSIWTTSYEVESGIECGCLKVTGCRGYIWVAGSDYSPIREFALHFWAEKARWTTIEGKRGLHTLLSKLYPNSTYGKLISAILDPDLAEPILDEQANLHGEKVYRAAGLYNPAIASLITGYVRGHLLHPKEHKWKSIHSSTDSIKTQMDVLGDPDIGKELGQWSVEVKGRCLLLRPKLYIHEADGEVMVDRKTGEPVVNPETGKPFPKLKYAMHGFRGQLKELIGAADYNHLGADSPILNGKKFDYFVNHCWSTRQSLIRKKKTVVPLDFQRIPMSLKAVFGAKPKVAVFA